MCPPGSPTICLSDFDLPAGPARVDRNPAGKSDLAGKSESGGQVGIWHGYAGGADGLSARVNSQRPRWASSQSIVCMPYRSVVHPHGSVTRRSMLQSVGW